MLHAYSPHSLVRFMYAYGNNRGNIHFVWKFPQSATSEELLTKDHSITSSLASRIDQFLTCAMHKEALDSFRHICDIQPEVLGALYHRMTGNTAASTIADQAAMDEQICLILDEEDEQLVWDLHHHNAGASKR